MLAWCPIKLFTRISSFLRHFLRRAEVSPAIIAKTPSRLNSPASYRNLPEANGKPNNKKVLILDLDETLIHGSLNPSNSEEATFIYEKEVEGRQERIYVKERPGLRKFLQTMSQYFEVIIFTASKKEYANPIIDKLDPEKLISRRFFRENCVVSEGHFIKDLTILDRELKDLIIIDNSPVAFQNHPENAILVPGFYGDPQDFELEKISEFLTILASIDDVRPIEKWGEAYNKAVNESEREDAQTSAYSHALSSETVIGLINDPSSEQNLGTPEFKETSNLS